MSLPGPPYAPFRLASLCVLLVSLGTVFVTSGFQHEEPPVKIDRPVEPESQIANVPMTFSSPPATAPFLPTPVPMAMSAVTATQEHSPEELLVYAPNELGVVPILEYHMITTNPDEVAQFVRLADDMRADLEWLYEHDFYIVPLRDVVNNSIAVPAGKHPVALTFDDGTSTQFSFVENDQGELIPDPDTAIGILETFYAQHPDFGRGGHFALLVYNGFALPDESQEPYLQQKIDWMIERGYEIGNHTWQHTDLTDIPNTEFMMTIAKPIIWADEHVGDSVANQSRILTLPYGSAPDKELHPDQRRMMREGFSYEDQEFRISAALLVGAEPALSPANALWDPMWIPRIQMFDESVAFWFGQFESGGVVLYTSDGNPDTIVVPKNLPPELEKQLDADALARAGKQVIRYDPESGQTTLTVRRDDALSVEGDRRLRLL